MEPTNPPTSTHQPIASSPVRTGGVRPPAPGELKIREKRTWKTWQLIGAMVAAALIGMLINYRTVPASGSGSGSSTGGLYAVPPPNGSSGTTTTAAATDGQATTTTASGDATTTEPATATSSTAPASTATTLPARVLLGPMQSQGNGSSAAFSVTSPGWSLGWAFQCSAAPSGSAFEIFVVPVGTSPSGTPAVNETGASGQSVTTESTVGQQMLIVQAPASCEWAVKVTGS